MDERLEKVVETFEWVKEIEQVRSIEQAAVLREKGAAALKAYQDGLVALDSKECGFTNTLALSPGTTMIRSQMNGRAMAQRAVLKLFNSVFKYTGPRKTLELTLKPEAMAGQGEYRTRIITIGQFGFGTRRTPKSNSVRVDDWQGVAFIILNAEIIAAELRKMGELKMADLLKLLADTVPITLLMDFPTFVRVAPSPRKIIGTRGVVEASMLSLQVQSRGTKWFVDFETGAGHDRIQLSLEFGGLPNQMIAFQQFEDLFGLVAEDARVRLEADLAKVPGLRDRFQTTFGNYLLGVSL